MNNVIFDYNESNPYRNLLKKKYNRLILNHLYPIAEKYLNNTRNLVKLKYFSQFIFKYSNYHQVEKPFTTIYENDSPSNKMCSPKNIKEDKSYYDDYFNHLGFADLFTKNISLCNGIQNDLEIPNFEQNSNIIFNLNYSKLQNLIIIDDFSKSINDLIQNSENYFIIISISNKTW